MVMIVVTFRLMPDSMRRKRVSQKNAPRTITKWDLHDEFGESPYRVTEVVADKLWSTLQYSTVQYSTVQVVADKLWSVNYRIEDPSMTGRLAASRGGATGYNPASEQFRAKVR